MSEEQESYSIFDSLEPMPEDHDHNVAYQVLAWLAADPPEDWDQPPKLMAFASHGDHIDRLMKTPLPTAEDEGSLLGAIRRATEDLRGMIAERGPIPVTIFSMALVMEAWIGTRLRTDESPTMAGDLPGDAEARLCYAATVGGGWSEAAYLREHDAYIQRGPADDEQPDVPGDTLFHTVGPEIKEAMQELLLVANTKE